MVYEITEALRQRILKDLQERLAGTELSLAAIEAALNSSLTSEQQAQLNVQKNRLLRSRDTAKRKLAEVETLQIGDRLQEGSVEFLSEIKAGDTEIRLHDAEIVIRDGIIVGMNNI